MACFTYWDQNSGLKPRYNAAVMKSGADGRWDISKWIEKLLGEETKSEVLTETACQTGRNGLLYARWWIPANREVEGTVVIVHGLGEHGGRYEGVAKELASEGWASLVTDLQGHGRSPGRRGHAKSYFGMLEDIGAMRKTALDRFASLPQVLMGHSMGGNLAVNYVIRRSEVDNQLMPLAGLILSGPMFLPTNAPTRPQIFAAWATGHLVPWFTVRAPVDTAKLSRNPENINSLRHDSLVHNRISVYLATQLLAQGRYALDHAAKVNVPTLMMHGEDDPITSFRATESFSIRAGSNVKFISFPGMLHEIFHESESEVVFETMLQWLRPIKGIRE